VKRPELRPLALACCVGVLRAVDPVLFRGRQHLASVPEAEEKIPSNRPAATIANPAQRAIVATVHQP
jgi:hypothetical protein